MKFPILILSILKISSAFEISCGSCPKVGVLSAFDLDANLTGKWFDYMKYPSIVFPEKCISIDISVNENAEIVIDAEGLSTDGPRNETHTSLLDPFGSIQINLSWFKFAFDFYVLDFDVNEFLVAYTCKNLFGKMANMKMVWIWSRNKELEEATYERAISALKKFNIPTEPLVKSEQELCN